MDTELVKLLGTESSFPCARIVWALKLKGIAYEFVEEDLLNKSSMLLEMNPVHKKVPVLLHDNKPVVESLVILEYIDENWPINTNGTCRLLPEDPYERAVARFWARFNDEKIVPSVWGAMISDGDENAIKSAQNTLDFLEDHIKGKKFFGGDEVGYLDLVIGWLSLWLSAIEEVGEMKILEPERFPSLIEWTHNFVKVPVIHESLPPRENVVSYFQFGLNYMRSLAAKQN